MSLENLDLWIIGDSFASNQNNEYWPNILEKKFVGKNKFLNSTNCKDIQTIMDLFYKNTFNISKDSLVLIFLPSLARIRFPKKIDLFKKSTDTHNIFRNENNKQINFDELFIHWPYNDYPNTNGRDELEFPFDTFNFEGHQNSAHYNVGLYYYENKELWKSQVVGSVNNFDFARLLNANDSTTKNWNDIFYSIKKTFNFNVEFFSWTDEYDSNIVWTKQRITNEIGWHTIHNDWEESNGIIGDRHDEHFSQKMHKSFSNMIVKMYSTHFEVQ